MFILSECIQKMGEKDFHLAHDFLRDARFGTQAAGKSLDENEIMRELRKIISKPSDCFILDQLLFLEEQQKIS